MKYVCLFLFALITNAGFSQAVTWCPPGAEWHYTIIPNTEPAYLHVKYQSDTIISGQPCRVLREHWRSWDFGTGQAFSSYRNRYSYAAGGVVYDFMFSPGLTTGTWDTLYNFNAVPGQSWHFHESGWNEQLTVQDTGSTQLNGQLLQWYTVKYTYMGSEYPLVDTVYEKIGSSAAYHPYRSPFLISDPGIAGLCNYSDDTFPDWTKTDLACRSMPSAVSDMVSGRQVKLIPNPASQQVLLRLTPASIPIGAKVLLHDYLGRQVRQQHISGPHTEISVSLKGLQQGLYLVSVDWQGWRLWQQQLVITP